MSEILTGIGGGIVSGMITATLGYAKSTGTEFDAKNFMQTVIVGGFVGGIAGYQGVTYVQSQDYVATTGALTLFEYVKKTILRRVVPWLKKKVSGGS